MARFERNREFRAHFGTPDRFRDGIPSLAAGKYVIDIFKFEDHCRTQGYAEEEHGSLADFVLTRYGQAALDFVLSVL